MKIVALFVALLAVLAGWSLSRPRDHTLTTDQNDDAVIRSAATEPRSAVLVELFTSEGCSSCPPADRLLADLERKQPVEGALVIPLSEHVDYWNRLGWTDPYSSRLFSDRQSEYARALGSERVYTPQMVVDGRYEFVGNDGAKSREVIAGAARGSKANVVIDRDESVPGTMRGDLSVRVRVERLPDLEEVDGAEVLLAITEGPVYSMVARGENAGSRLSHIAVVRSLNTIGKIKSREAGFSARRVVRLDPRWHRANLRAVAFVQATKSRTVLGAATASLAE
ncbi:MAG TPA: DUF1223 domain-containing protein [Blastocatellia bacterium]|nr:DUF1223 domain-containing protein [Blastocatellia bacterium]